MLSDVYYPTIDNTNVETIQYVVTDGSTFTDLQPRERIVEQSRCTRRHGARRPARQRQRLHG